MRSHGGLQEDTLQWGCYIYHGGAIATRDPSPPRLDPIKRFVFFPWTQSGPISAPAELAHQKRVHMWDDAKGQSASSHFSALGRWHLHNQPRWAAIDELQPRMAV